MGLVLRRKELPLCGTTQMQKIQILFANRNIILELALPSSEWAPGDTMLKFSHCRSILNYSMTIGNTKLYLACEL